MTTRTPMTEPWLRYPARAASGSRSWPLTCAQELLILAHDETSGKRMPTGPLAYPLAAATLMDLSHRGRIACSTERVTVLDDRPTGVGFLDGALAQLVVAPGEFDLQSWLHRLRDESGALERELLCGLVAAGTLRREKHRTLGLVPSCRYPTVDARAEKELKRRLLDALLRDGIPAAREVSLVALADAAHLLPGILSARETMRLAARVSSLRRRDAVAQALYDLRLDMELQIAKATAYPYGVVT